MRKLIAKLLGIKPERVIIHHRDVKLIGGPENTRNHAHVPDHVTEYRRREILPDGGYKVHRWERAGRLEFIYKEDV